MDLQKALAEPPHKATTTFDGFKVSVTFHDVTFTATIEQDFLRLGDVEVAIALLAKATTPLPLRWKEVEGNETTGLNTFYSGVEE